MWYRINSPAVADEIIDHEVIIIHFDTGTYYNTEGVGAEVWAQIKQGVAVDEIVAALVKCYTENRVDIAAAVQGFVAELQREALIVPLAGQPDTTATAADSLAVEAGTAFERPVLHKYTDMQDLFLLDPIHDVDEQGWPLRKQ